MDGLVMAGQLILGLSIIVTLHELGHFLAARAFGIRVEKFYLFFDAWGVKLFSFKKGDTEYGIGWLPLGGYVKIAGMVDESMDKEAMKLPPKADEFRSKPAWQRLIVMIGGVVVNFILGVVILAFITLHYDKEYLPVDSIDNGIYAYELGKEVGFETGDKIIAVNGSKIDRFSDITSQSNLMGASITVLRNGEEVEVIIPDDFYKNYTKKTKPLFIRADNYEFVIDSVVPGFAGEAAGLQKEDKVISINNTFVGSFGEFRSVIIENGGNDVVMTLLRQNDTLDLTVSVDSSGIIGVVAMRPPYEYKEYSMADGIKYGVKDGVSILSANMKGFGKIFSGKEKATDSLQGPIGIATIYGSVWNWHRFWFLTAMISLVLGFMNILPIPALDGGHVVFLLIEVITGRPVSENIMEKAQMVGMFILLALMVFVIGNDIWKHILN
ncbi:MAG: RIP metalloprotease RseP [Bacteroidetes bacterium 4572_112]|nr:MAG: RIP metalloprotease RseP [Bacteroidetes bacterium 4572_112]